MKRAAIGGLLLCVLLTACSSQPTREGADPKKSAALNAELGLRYMLQGKNDLALEKLERALDQDRDSAMAHHYLAELYRRLDRPEKAGEHYRAALRSAPEQSALRNNYGVFLCGEKRYSEAEEQFLEVLENPVYRARADVYENLGLCVRQKPDSEKAERYFRQALRLNAKLPKSLLAMAEIGYEQKNFFSARAHLQRYQEVAAHSPATLWLGVRIERALGDKNAAASYGMLLTANFPDSREAARYRALEKE